MFFVAAGLSGYGNWLPQVEGGFPPKEDKLDFSTMTPQQLADEGEKIIFGGVGQNKVQGAIGKGQCPLCHALPRGDVGRAGAEPDWPTGTSGEGPDWKIPSTQRVIRARS